MASNDSPPSSAESTQSIRSRHGFVHTGLKPDAPKPGLGNGGGAKAPPQNSRTTPQRTRRVRAATAPTTTLTVRLPMTDAEHVRQAAAAADLTVSMFLADRLAAIPPAIPRAARAAPPLVDPTLLAALRAVEGQIRRAGNVVNQSAHGINIVLADLPLPPDLERYVLHGWHAAVDAIGDAARELAALRDAINQNSEG